MTRIIFSFLISLVTISVITGASFIAGQDSEKLYNDGPYVKISKDSVLYMWMEEGEVNNTTVHKSAVFIFDRPSLPKVTNNLLDFEPDAVTAEYETEEPIFALSDIHGQYELMKQILSTNGVIDDQDQWTFGKGHLVLAGDVMGRGDRVTECQWFIMKLEKQAEKAGGKLHFLLGNHELMVMHGYLDYANEKYKYTSANLGFTYNQLYASDQLFGKWLSGKNVVLKINNVLYVHGGISQEVLDFKLSIPKINETFKTKIYFQSPEKIASSKVLSGLYFEEGPLWYRGYAYPYSFNPKKIDAVKKRYKIDHIVVGHTTLSEIKALYNNQVILIDSGIKNGEFGEALVIEKGEFRVVDNQGRNRELVSEENKKEKKVSLFEHMYGKDALIAVIPEEFSTLKKALNKNEPVQGVVDFFVDKEQLSFTTRYELGGKTRRTICVNPPVKINLVKSELSNFNFKKDLDKFKFVFQCDAAKSKLESLMQEKLVYDLYSVVSEYSHRTQLIKVKVGKNRNYLQAFILEDDDEVAARNKAQRIKVAAISLDAVDRKEYVRMCLFQFMIANTDWSARRGHNTEIFQRLEDKTFVITPYDFDYAGIINNSYAVVAELIPVERVTDRYFMDKKVTYEELTDAVSYFLSKENELLDTCDQAIYLSEGTRKRMRRFIEGFYKIIGEEKQLKFMLK